jgi:hypothetical protein
MTSPPASPVQYLSSSTVERTRRFVATVRGVAPHLSSRGTRSVSRLVRRIAFWAAICIPLVLLGLLGTGLSTLHESLLFVTLVAAELMALIVGHAHQRE